MKDEARARFQIRVVVVVHRAEMVRLAAVDVAPSTRLEWEDGLRRRSLALLDRATAGIDRRARWRSELLGLIHLARREVQGHVNGV